MKRKDRPYCICMISLGCAKNLVDSEVMCGALATEGFALSSDPEGADMILINTCSFIADARSEADEEIRAALKWKRRSPRRRAVAVAGCLPQRDPRAVASTYPQVDLFLGLDDVPHAARRIRELLEHRLPERNVPATAEPTYLYDETTPRLLLTPHAYAFVKIAEGCNHRCAFCVIPHIRGHQRSRTIASVVSECRQLLDQGVRELNIVAQDSTRYGQDLDEQTNLPALIRACDELEGDFWLRILYTHPQHVSNDLLEMFSRSPHLVPYLDMPLQHISERILKSMHRAPDGAGTRRLLEHVRATCPNVAIRTTFIVGYPGETEADFVELLDFVRESRFERLGVFAYSPEEGTPAAGITAGIVPPEVANERRAALLEVQRDIALQHNQALVGRTLTVIADHATDATHITARTQADAPEVDNLVHIEADPDCIERGFLTVRITGADPYDLQAVLLNGTTSGMATENR